MKRGQHMTKEKKEAYETHESLRKIIVGLKGRKFKLFCGHHVSFGYSLGNNIHISNGKRPEIICSCCSY